MGTECPVDYSTVTDETTCNYLAKTNTNKTEELSWQNGKCVWETKYDGKKEDGVVCEFNVKESDKDFKKSKSCDGPVFTLGCSPVNTNLSNKSCDYVRTLSCSPPPKNKASTVTPWND